MKRYCFDLETNGLLNEKLIDYSAFPYKLKPHAVIHCGYVFDIDSGERWGYRPDEIHLIAEKLKEADMIVGHNIINFDLLFLRLKYGISYFVSDDPDTMDEYCGKPIRIIDTLVLSKTLNPDRHGGHSLKQFGKSLDNAKIVFGDEEENETCWEVFSEDMFVYCEQDVNLNVDVFNRLIAEAGGLWSDEWYRYWSKAFHLEQAVKELITRQEHFGFDFDEIKAKSTVEDLNRLLAECEAEAEPHLPERPLSKSKQPKFPAKPFLMSGGISSTGLKWIERLELLDAPQEEQIKALQEQRPVILTEPMKLSSQEDIKKYLVSIGWRPTKWNERDLFVESDKKTPSTYEQYEKRVNAYVEKTFGTSLSRYRFKKLGLLSLAMNSQVYRSESMEGKKHWLKDWFLSKWDDKEKGKIHKLVAYTLPKFTVDIDKNMCPNLERLVEEIPYSKAIVHWLTYRHRRNSILSPKGTGWLTQRRESDGRIPTPADSCGCNTTRMRHIGVANVPRVSSLYGAPLRDLFGAGDSYYQIGTDGDAIEARVQGHYILHYRGGKEEAALLLAPKPNDVHTVTAKALGIGRDQAKTVRYSISYGAQPAKLAADNGWTLQEAKRIFNNFWKANAATAALKTTLIGAWEKTGRTYIRGIDGRKLATRSAHSLLNTVFQSCGVIVMKKAHLISDRKAKAEGYCNDPFEGRPTALSMICYHDEDQKAVIQSDFKFHMFEDEDSAKQFKQETEMATGLRYSDIGHVGSKYRVGYSRIGELTALALEESAEHFNLDSPITGGYMIGKSWAQCH